MVERRSLASGRLGVGRAFVRPALARLVLLAIGSRLLVGAPFLNAQELQQQRIVMGLNFRGNSSVPATVLAAGISTTVSGWFRRTPPFKWLGLGEKRFFDERQFVADVLRIQAIYKLSGFLDVKVDTLVRRSPQTVNVTFKITEGMPVRVTDLVIAGLDSVSPHTRQAVIGGLPLRVGDPFNRFLLGASADSIVRRLRNHGYPGAAVFRNFDQDAPSRTAKVTLQVDPGRLSHIGTIRVDPEGTSPVDTTFVRAMVPAKRGRLFSQDELFISQRNLYRTELFQFASVGIDSDNFKPTDSLVPLLVRTRAGKIHRVRGSLGYGTTDCLRGTGGWRARNFLGGGRIFDLSGRVSKVGVGSPLDAGLDGSVCSQLKQDSIGSTKLNYDVTASVEKPGFFGPLNTVTYAVFADRRSEFRIYLRDEIGTSFTIRREGLKRVPLTLSYKLSYGRTQASSATFCAFFSACTQSDIDLLGRRRFLGTLTANISLPRADNVLDPANGYVISAEGTLSSRFIGSAKTQQFEKIVLDGAWYRQLDRDIVLSWRLRGGAIFAPRLDFSIAQAVSFVPPDERFYAGGPNDVRGYQRNELGPVVYVVETADSLSDATVLQRVQNGTLPVRFSATGGNTLFVGNVELRVPSPILRSRMRLAVFVDAGTVWERGGSNRGPTSPKVTPGFGFRFATPLGPARLDIAYNGYARQPGTLYRSSLASGSLKAIQPNFVTGQRSNITFQFAIGQPF